MRKPNNRRYYQSRKGFTLIEIAATLGILSLLLIVIYSFFIESYNFQNFISEQNDAISIARDGVEQLVYELREADMSDTGAYPLVLADSQELVFYSDIDADILTEKVHYFLDGTNLMKGVVEADYDPLAEQPYTYNGIEQLSIVSTAVQNNTNAIFSYYNGDYPEDDENNPLSYPSDPTAVKLIKMNLQININPYKVPDTYLLENYVQLRNLKENL